MLVLGSIFKARGTISTIALESTCRSVGTPGPERLAKALFEDVITCAKSIAVDVACLVLVMTVPSLWRLTRIKMRLNAIPMTWTSYTKEG